MAASVPEQVPINEYTATGLTDTFAYQFEVVQASDLKIYLDGVLQTTGFTISGIGNQNGGSVVFTSTNPVGILRLERDIPLKRETDYQKHGDFREVVVDADFNRIWQKLQDIAAKLIGLVRVHYSETINEIPRLADRVNKALGFDAQGNFVAIPSDLPALVGMLEQAEEAKDAAQAAAAQAENRVPWTGPDGVAILPACKVADLVIADLPASGLLVTQDTDSGFPMWFDRAAAQWKRLDPAKVAADLVTANAKIEALENELENSSGYTIIYPNGGTEAAPATVSINTRYINDNPFPGRNIDCRAEVFYNGLWFETKWEGNAGTGAVAGGVIATHTMPDDNVVIQTGLTHTILTGAQTGGGGGAVGSISTPVPCRVKVWKKKGAA